MLDKNSADNNFDLTQLQAFLLSDEPDYRSTSAQNLSITELEALLAQKRREQARQNHRKLRNRQADAHADEIPKVSPIQIPNLLQTKAKVAQSEATTDEERHSKPASLIVKKPKQAKAVAKNRPILNVVGYALETVVIIAGIFFVGNWSLQQLGLSFNLFNAVSIADFAVAPSRSDGIFLMANAPGIIYLSPTPTPSPKPTFTPIIASQGTVSAVVTRKPILAPTVSANFLAIAPTPTPAIVQPILQSLEDGAAPPPPPASPARRLIIPKLGLDSPIKEVTINLGTWQVADNAVGHHMGTAMAGQAGNMVLAGHRDIRGSVFLRINELKRGDEFRIVTDTAVYRYIVTESSEVAPTEISVMAATFEPTATLITCTPIGLATKRLIVKARLDK